MAASTKEHTITGADGETYVQRRIDIRAPIPERRMKGKRIRVYNKYRARVHCSDCVLEPESEGSILESDFAMPQMQEYVIKIA